ncbi:5-formyltetrahydrofolate cyclo-ligase [Acidithiobacillus caldus]|uniref:5-formyltetrahydrofolate cyclo-ligase n=1 Tax=Acidithiobacillus caldus TaxID=33059 RepID=UPI001C07048D|nr:5-formyltetrahydrofolate cyclo-ligase [Acidithiobacillus caldus]MBU2790295.1 5-formyltetrahydrofolate cyclo-ligase [Acidithiobacillus caldus]MBU2820372.1 5-formyltetrahydrofolate cyclo-ligase [Acidithiobacillus caldus]
MRRHLRRMRSALTPRELASAQRALARHLLGDRAFQKARRIGVYWPVSGEISPLGVLGHPRTRNKIFYFPVLAGPHARMLRFAPMTPAGTWANNRLGIPEPQARVRAQKSWRHLDLLIVPLVAFDGSGGRLGMGGGFYDRSLAARGHRRHWRKPRLIGVGHAFQELPVLPREAWDVALDAVCTEKGWRRWKL